MLVDNKLLKKDSLLLKGLILEKVKAKTWPMRDSCIAKTCRQFMAKLQTNIAMLSKQGLHSEAFKLIDFYSFHIINRIFSIQQISSSCGKATPGFDGFTIRDDKEKLLLLDKTKYTATLLKKKVTVMRVYMPKGKNTLRSLGIGDILDRVLQMMLVNTIDPYYDVMFDPDTYGWRRGRSQVHAVSQLYKYLEQGQEDKTIISLDIKSFFDNISIPYLKSIKVPSKFRSLTDQ
jgi:RNA-directed DNA polymerase